MTVSIESSWFGGASILINCIASAFFARWQQDREQENEPNRDRPVPCPCCGLLDCDFCCEANCPNGEHGAGLPPDNPLATRMRKASRIYRKESIEKTKRNEY